MLSLWKYVLKNVINQHTVVLFQRTDIYPKKIFRSKAFSLKALFADFFFSKTNIFNWFYFYANAFQK